MSLLCWAMTDPTYIRQLPPYTENKVSPKCKDRLVLNMNTQNPLHFRTLVQNTRTSTIYVVYWYSKRQYADTGERQVSFRTYVTCLTSHVSRLPVLAHVVPIATMHAVRCTDNHTDTDSDNHTRLCAYWYTLPPPRVTLLLIIPPFLYYRYSQRCQETAILPLDGRGQGKRQMPWRTCLDGKTRWHEVKIPRFFKRLSILLKTCIFLVIIFIVPFFFFAFRSTIVVYVHDVLMCWSRLVNISLFASRFPADHRAKNDWLHVLKLNQ